jgi:hypothetical protein
MPACSPPPPPFHGTYAPAADKFRQPLVTEPGFNEVQIVVEKFKVSQSPGINQFYSH